MHSPLLRPYLILHFAKFQLFGGQLLGPRELSAGLAEPLAVRIVNVFWAPKGSTQSTSSADAAAVLVVTPSLGERSSNVLGDAIALC